MKRNNCWLDLRNDVCKPNWQLAYDLIHERFGFRVSSNNEGVGVNADCKRLKDADPFDDDIEIRQYLKFVEKYLEGFIPERSNLQKKVMEETETS